MATEYTKLEVDGEWVPVKVIRERRKSIRAYLGKECLIVRFPTTIDKALEAAHWERLREWLSKHEKKRPGALAQYQERGDYQDGDELLVGGRRYLIRITETERATHQGKLKAGVISLNMALGVPEPARKEAMRTLLSRLIGNDFLPAITQRVHELNQQHFQKNIKSVKLKYNHSNWGSCSSSGNINLSTRLLFAPQMVIDYVIIHELAHLTELNHSDRYWKLVATAMPDYESHEKWLKENGYQCDF